MKPMSSKRKNSTTASASDVSMDYEKLATDLKEKTQQLELIAQIQSRFIREPDARDAFEALLSAALCLTESAYGFIGEVLFTEEKRPYLRAYAITDIAWNEETAKAYAEQMAVGGMEFRNMSTLFGHCIVTGECVISNDPANDPRSGKGLPPGHPPLKAFLGVPIKRGELMIGMIGLANRSEGYHEDVAKSLETMVATFATLIDARRANELRNQYESEILALNSAMEKQMDAMDANLEGLALLDKGCFSYMNPAYARMYGYETKDLIGKSWELLFPESVLQDIKQRVFPILQGQGNWRGELTGQRADGSKVAALVSLTLLPDGQVVCSSSDISQRKHLEADLEEHTKALRMMNDDLKAALLMKDQFTASMSHELRTPLNAILGYAELLESGVGGSLQKTQQGYIRKLTVSAEHLLALINDILDLSKIEAKSAGLNLAEVEVNKLCHSAVDLVRNEAERKRIRLEFVSLPTERIIPADKRRLRQIIVNLMDNAIKFSPSESLVQITAEIENVECQWLRLEVKDYGIGIAAKDFERIFEPFEQLDQGLNRQFEGTGLGLNLVRQLVQMHDGRIDVSSTLGMGSSFVVRIPGVLKSAGHKAADTEADSSSPVSPRLRGQRIMLVEDNHFNRDTIESFLRAQSAEVICAQDGLEAVDLASREKLDLILMDIQMPRLDGLDAIKRIRQQSENNDVPIIALTALALTGDSERCLSAGANDYLAKPVKLRKLVDVIQQNLAEVPPHE